MMELLEILVGKGAINRYQVDAIARAVADGKTLDEVLDGMKVPSDTIRAARSQFYGIPERSVSPDDVSYTFMKMIPEEAAAHYRFVPIGLREGVLQVGMIDPSDLEARNALQFITSKSNTPTEVFVISSSDYQKVLEAYKGVSLSGSGEEEQAKSAEENLINISHEAADDTPVQVAAAGTIVEDAPATKTIAVILKNAVEGNASDIHIEHTGDEVKVRYRVDGTLYTSLRTDKNMHSALVARVKVLAKLKLDERRKPQDGRFMATVEDRKVDFRVSVLPTFYGEKVVIRILDPGRGVKKLDDVGFTAEHLQMVRDALARPYGMILITGPTGSGKTTTLYAMLQEIDREKLNVTSLEDPVEYNVAGINQSQVKPEIGYTFANGLRSILRQDPDVIMVGEIRDAETAELAINAALTGHLVFATLHTNNSVGVVPRLVDMGIDPYLIAPTLILSMAQRLVKKLEPGAGVPVAIDEARQMIIDQEFKDLPPEFKSKITLGNQLYETKKEGGVEVGLKGRLAVFEMFPIDRELERIMLKSPTSAAIYDHVRKKGMLSMKEDALMKCTQGIIPWGEVNTL